MLRAGPFSDERVTGLANRRFVPFFFDLSVRGAAGDPDARRFLVQAHNIFDTPIFDDFKIFNRVLCCQFHRPLALYSTIPLRKFLIPPLLLYYTY